MTAISRSNKYAEIEKRMQALDIFEKDIQEQFIRSSGPGGQNVNKVATCVHLVHIQTGIRVKCQDYRTQMPNRFKAREMLIEKICLMRDEKEREKKHFKEKLKRQKRRRTKKGKELMLQAKRKKSEKKKLRRKVNPNKGDDL